MPKTSPSAFRANLAPDLAALGRATAGLQRTVHAELRSTHASASSTRSSTSISKSTRKLRLLIVLWEEGERDRLMRLLMSVVGERGPKMNTGDCLICTEPLSQKEMVSLEGCGHTTCKDCLRQYITSRLGEKAWPIFCPICVAEGGSQRKARGMVYSFHSYSSRPYSQLTSSGNTAPGGRTRAPTVYLEPVDGLRTLSIRRACHLSKVRSSRTPSPYFRIILTPILIFPLPDVPS